MKTSLIIRHKHLYQIWFIDVLRRLAAKPARVEGQIRNITKQQDKYFQTLFKVGHIEPRTNVTTESKVFQAHLKGLQLVGQQIAKFSKKYPELTGKELNNASWTRIVSDWANVLAGQAAAASNTQAADEAGPFDDADRCVDAWLAYDEAIIELGMAKDNLDDCRFQNSNPPLDETQDDDNPFGGDGPELDPCLTYAMDVTLWENNVNAAWDDIRVWC